MRCLEQLPAEGEKWRRILAIAASLAGLLALVAALAARVRSPRKRPPSSLSHLVVGRIWEYDVFPEGGLERTEVLQSWTLPDGRTAFHVEYRRQDTAIDATYTDDGQGRLIQLSQSATATFDPPLVGLGELRVGAFWSTTSWMVFPSMFRANAPTTVTGKVVAHETVSVPAGTFQAFRIDAVVNGRASTSRHVPGLGMVREVSAGEELRLRRLTDARNPS